MKQAIFFLLLAGSLAATAQQKQSLKDLLYGGKLKLDSTSVIRKNDDLSTKIDTSTKKPQGNPKNTTETDGVVKSPVKNNDMSGGVVATDSVISSNVNKSSPAPVKTNSKVWKEYSDSLITVLKAEALSSKKVKKETYYFTVDTEITTDGSVSIANVICDPENEFLQLQVKDRLTSTPPRLSPTTDSNGQPRKTKKKFSFNITKE